MKNVLVFGLIAAAGCKSKPPAAPSADVSRAVDSAVVESPRDAGAPETRAAWSSTPPMTGSVQLTLERNAAGLRLHDDRVDVTLVEPVLSDCVSEIPSIPTDDGTEETVRWVVLRGEAEAASLRFSTRGVLLVADAGCLRVGDLTPALLGTAPGHEADVFDQRPVDGEPAPTLTHASMRRSTSISRDDRPILEVSHFEGRPSFTAVTTESGLRASLVIEQDVEWNDGESAAMRQHSLTWLLDATPTLLLDVDVRFGADGPDHEEEQIVITRRHPVLGGAVRVDGERVQVEHALNVGAGKCPQMEGAISFEHNSETVRWLFESADGERLVASTKRERTSASGCLDAVPTEERRPGRLFRNRVPDDAVSWRPHN